MKFLVYFLLLISNLYPAELILKSGEVFICEQMSENEFQIKVRWNGNIYIIPKSEIASFDPSKNGKHIAYKIIDIELKDGSKFKGAIAEEFPDRLILKTDIGFINVEKSKIKHREEAIEVSIPEKYREEDDSPIYMKAGFHGIGLLNGRPLSPEIRNSLGGGIFIEPVSLILKSKYQIGFRSEYIVAKGEGNLDFFNTIIYSKYDYKVSNLQDYYLVLGLGTSYGRYRISGESSAGLNPLVNLEIGWQGLKWDKYFLRTGIRLIGILEKGSFFPQIGLELGIGKNF